MKKPLTLSIVIPVYNEERYLDACLRAIAAQTDKPDEVIVVDNGSTDKSTQITKKYPFVKLLYEPRRGTFYARNRGFDAAQGTLIGRIDADTQLPKDWIKRVKDFYQNDANSKTALSGGGHFINVRLPRFSTWWHGQIAFRANRLLLGHYILWGSNCALPKDLWPSVKPFVCERLDIHEDLDLSIHLHRQGYQIMYKENLRVGVVMRRVRSNRKELLANMMLWPRALKVHGLKTWVFGWLGAAMLYSLSLTIPVAEALARLTGRPSLSE